MTLKLSFLGGAGTVTGSKFLVENGHDRILVDCGLFQSYKNLRLKNWADFPVPPQSIGAVVLTHAHIDHSGYLPVLVKQGFTGTIYCTSSTRDLCEILLPDAAFLQEKDAESANRHGYSKHTPALPLFTSSDADQALSHLKPQPFEQDIVIPGSAKIRFRRAGHILGAASVLFEWHGRTIAFSGDLGRYGDPLMLDPEPFERADYLLVESTYGDRVHNAQDPQDALSEIVGATIARGGTVVIPAFAVGRAQTLLFHLHKLRASGRIPSVPVFIDSPMALDATDVFSRNKADHRLSADETRKACAAAKYVRSMEDSKALDTDRRPKIILSASGMATGGRVLYHLKRYVSDERNTILFAGFQAGGTRGAAMLAGATSIKIHGEYFPVHAQVENLDMLSAHADANEIMRWLRGFKAAPRTTFITHGEPAAADALRRRIEEELHWQVIVPDHGQQVQLS